MPNDRIRLTLELDTGSRNPKGILASEDGTVRAFDGWMELAEAVEQAQQPDRDAAPDAKAGKVTALI